MIVHLHPNLEENGHEYIFDTCRQLNEAGYPCAILIPYLKKFSKQSFRGVKVINYGGWPDLFILFRSFMFKFYSTLKIIHRWHKAKKPFSILLACLHLFEIKATILHVQRSFQGNKGMSMSEICRIPWVLHLRGYDVRVRPLVDESWKNDLKILLTRSGGIIAVSEDLKKKACEYADIQNKIFVSYPGVKRHDAPAAYRYDNKQTYTLLTVGRLVWEKGYIYALDALQILMQKGYSNWRYIIVGDGSEWQALRYQAEQLNLSKNIIFRGKIQREEVYKELRKADIYIQPSVSEALSVSLCEAMAAGLPCIVTDVGGMPEIITHGNNGRIVPPREPLILADEIALLLSDDGIRRKLGNNAYQTSLKYNLGEENKQLVVIYGKILSK